MSNRRTHLIAGTTTGLGFAAYRARNESLPAFVAETVGGAIAGTLGGLGPDLVEPAIHSWHRSTAHSYAAAAAIVATTVHVTERWQEYCRARAQSHNEARAIATSDPARLFHGFMAFLWHLLSGFVAGLPAGYLSHLVLDSFTPRGIPLLV